MSGSSYHRIARLATHPAWSHRKVALICPVCHTAHLRVSDYDRDFLAHEPAAELAWRWLSGRRYEREAPRRGWPCADDTPPGRYPMSMADAQLDQQMAANRDVHEDLVQLARDAFADGIPTQVLLDILHRHAMEQTPGQIAAAYACAVMRDAERTP